MADLRIVDTPVLLQESITDDVKMPTGGLGNFSIRLGDIVWYVVTKEQLANKNYVDLSSKGVKDSLDVHITDKANPHNVTKAQVGLGNVDNTADVDKPVSNAVTNALIGKSDKTDTYTKNETDNRIAALASTTFAGHKGYATLADAQAAQSSLVINTVVEVTNDSDVTKNGVYLWNGTTLTKSNNDVLGQARASIRAEIRAINQAVFDSKTINKLDPNSLLNGYEVYGDGTLRAESNSVVSNLIDVRNSRFVTISGLQANLSINRYCRFLDDENKLINFNTINMNDATLSVPTNATWLQITLKQRNTDTLDLSKAQVELSNNKSTYVAFIQGDIIGLHGTHIKQNPMLFDYLSIGKNLFDKSKAILGYEVYGDGTLSAYPGAVASDYLIVNGLSQITLSGLQNNTEFNRYYAFYDSNKTSILMGKFTSNTVTITVPSNAKYFRFSLLQRTATTFDGGNTVQVESGSTATSYEAYKQGINSINGIEIVKSLPTTPSNISRAYGAKYLFFGDSITETSNVEQGIFTDTAYRSNWTKFAKDMLKMSDFKNYARSGASFIEYNGQLTWQKISHQVNTAITNAENPDIIVLACGTNDGNINLGSYETAMSKDIASLDMSITAEAMRWALYQISKNFHNAICFYSTQLQRADVEPTEREAANSLMVKLAKRYGFNIIDCMNESGIVRDFEVWQANGRYLSDGLHPNIAGQQVQANYIVSQIIERMTY